MLVWFLLFLSCVGGYMVGRADNDCSPTATVTTSIVNSEKYASGLEFLTMEPMPSAGTAQPEGSYEKDIRPSSSRKPSAGQARAWSIITTESLPETRLPSN